MIYNKFFSLFIYIQDQHLSHTASVHMAAISAGCARLMLELKRGGEERLPAPEGTPEEAWYTVVWEHFLRWCKLCLRGGTADRMNVCRKAYIHSDGEMDKFVVFCAEFPPLLKKPASKAKAAIEVGINAMFTATPQDNNGAVFFNVGESSECEMTRALFHDEVYDINPKKAWGF